MQIAVKMYSRSAILPQRKKKFIIKNELLLVYIHSFIFSSQLCATGNGATYGRCNRINTFDLSGG